MSISSFSFMGNYRAFSRTCYPYITTSRWVLLFVLGVAERNEDAQ